MTRLYVREPTCVLEWPDAQTGPAPPRVWLPVANMVPDPLAWLRSFARHCATPPTSCHVLLPEQREHKVPNRPDDPPPPEAGAPPYVHPSA